MKNLLIFNSPSKKILPEYESLIKIQIDNSLALGWKLRDIIFAANFDYEYKGVKSLITDDYEVSDSNKSTKIPVINELFARGLVEEGEIYWFHDSDAFEFSKIEPGELEMADFDAGFTDHGWGHVWNAGSFFFKKSSKDIFLLIYEYMVKKTWAEQISMTYLTDNNVNNISGRIKRMNVTYNFNTHYVRRNFKKAVKPIKVGHFHPTIAKHMDVFKNGKNDLGLVLLPDHLTQIFQSYGLITKEQR